MPRTNESGELRERLFEALYLLRHAAYANSYQYPGTCVCCGWPEDGHHGPGRYKGNAENTHEQGCSLDEVLNGRPAPRLRRCNDWADFVAGLERQAA